MNRKDLVEEIEYIEKAVLYFSENPSDPDFAFFAHCQMPDVLCRIKEAMQPWYVRLWWTVKGLYWRIFPSDEIPF